MNPPNLYGTWLTAGNTLQPAGDWAVANWGWITGAIAYAAGIWALTLYIRSGRDDYRSRNDRVAARRITRIEHRPEPAAPGNDEQLLERCNQILAATNTRKEKP